MFRPALTIFVELSLITGLAYPLATAGIANLVFPHPAAGSLVLKDGKPVSSTLILQSFSDLKYFWSRPSATGPMANNASASSGSNQGPLNPALVYAVKGCIDTLRAADPGNTGNVPGDLVNASASGLDPHISVAATEYQTGRVARLRKLPLERVQALITEHTAGALLGFLGEPRVNVLLLKLALDAAR